MQLVRSLELGDMGAIELDMLCVPNCAFHVAGERRGHEAVAGAPHE